MRDVECLDFLRWALPRMRMRWEGFRKVRRQVCKRLARRIADLGLPDVAAYRLFLESRQEEWPILDTMCTVTISRFYRDRGVFNGLRQETLPQIAADAVARGDETLRAWSAGCASGEEPYTLSMVWHLDVARQFPTLDLQIVATDVDDQLLSRARSAHYEEGSLRELPSEWRELAFAPDGNLFCLRDELRRTVEFQHQDVRERMPEGLFHLVLCRYLIFTYFDEAMQRALAARIVAHMIPGAVLVLGAHETIPADIPGLARHATGTWVYCPKGRAAGGG